MQTETLQDYVYGNVPGEESQTDTVAGRRSLKIAVIGIRGLPSSYSGIESACDQLYRLLTARGHDITVYCRKEYRLPGVDKYCGIMLRTTPAVRRRSLETISHAFTSLVTALRLKEYDIIHFHAEATGLFTPLCRLFRMPTIITVHGLDWQRAKWKGAGAAVLRHAEKSLASSAGEVIVVSKDLQRYFAKKYARTTRYIPNGVGGGTETENIDESVLEKYGLSRNRYILYLARLVPEKRVQDLIRAFMEMRTSMKLAVVGEGVFSSDYVDTLKLLASEEPRIVFTGFQQRPAVRCLFQNASVFVLPSEMEGLPVSLLECIDAGVPAIVSDIPPHRELFGCTPQYDLFFQPGDIDELRRKIEAALANIAHYRRLAIHNRSLVRRAFSWQLIAEETEQAYYDAVDSCSTSKRRGTCAS